MKKSKVLFSSLFICIMFIAFLAGCSNDEKTNEDTKSKINQELDYLDTQIVSILNKLNNISLQNYAITSEEVRLEEKNSSDGESSGTDENSSAKRRISRTAGRIYQSKQNRK